MISCCSRVGIPAMKLIVAVTIGATVSAEVSRADGTAQFPPARLGQTYQIYEASGRVGPEGDGNLDAARVPAVLTLHNALALALLHSPDLAAYSWEVRATEAGILQAGLPPNPELGVELENFGGVGERRGFRSSEMTLSLSQLIELGGKRSKRERIAMLERDVAELEFEAKRIDTYVDTAKAFATALVAQRRFALKEEQLSLAEKVRDTVLGRMRAGRASSIEDVKAEVELESQRVEVRRASRNLEAARHELAATWGAKSVAFSRVEGELSAAELPPLTVLTERLRNNPDLAGAETRYRLRQSNLDLERAMQVPDVTVSAGVRRDQDTDDNVFLLGFSIPIPVFGPNSGNVLKAERRVPQQRHLERSMEVAAVSKLQEKYSVAAALRAELVALDTKLLPGAEKAFAAAREGYEQGKFAFIDVLDAQRTLFSARERRLETASEFHQALLDIERLTASPLTPVQSDRR